jgi:uncharacterized short protein YbdD (DUF466 family)
MQHKETRRCKTPERATKCLIGLRGWNNYVKLGKQTRSPEELAEISPATGYLSFHKTALGEVRIVYDHHSPLL